MKVKTFPKLIYVRIEHCTDDAYLMIEEDGVTSLNEDGERVALYQLVEQGTVSVKRQFVPRKKRS